MNYKARLEEIRSELEPLESRNKEIEGLLEKTEEIEELRNLETEVDQNNNKMQPLLEERAKLEQKLKVAEQLNKGEGEFRQIQKPDNKEERSMMTSEQILSTPQYRSAFLKTLQGKPLTDEEKRDFTLVPDTAGATVPTQTSDKIFDNMTKIAPMLNEIELLRVAGNLRFAVQGTRNAAAAHAENAAVAPAADTMVTVTLTGFEFMKVIRISKTIQTMGIDQFENWISKILGEDLAVQIDNEIINGGTVTGNIATAQAWADNVNQITYVANVSYNNLTDLIALLPSWADKNAKFLMNKAMFYQQIMQITDGAGNLIATRDLSSAATFRILGYPVLIDDNMAAGEAYLGDFKQVVGNLAQDISVERSTESGFLNNAIDFRGTCIFDCDVAQPTAIVKLNV